MKLLILISAGTRKNALTLYTVFNYGRYVTQNYGSKLIMSSVVRFCWFWFWFPFRLVRTPLWYCRIRRNTIVGTVHELSVNAMLLLDGFKNFHISFLPNMSLVCYFGWAKFSSNITHVILTIFVCVFTYSMFCFSFKITTCTYWAKCENERVLKSIS